RAATKIEDYALLGDCTTAALVSRNGSLDWLCWPRFDSSACCAALLGGPEQGRWLLAPQDPAAREHRAYVRDPLILETGFDTTAGAVSVTDFMPVHREGSHVVRVVSGRRGHVHMRIELILRFDYGFARAAPLCASASHARPSKPALSNARARG